jgi:hypothetical protein
VSFRKKNPSLAALEHRIETDEVFSSFFPPLLGVLNPRNSLKWHQEVFRFIGEFTNTKD